jgi:hypothetical protein
VKKQMNGPGDKTGKLNCNKLISWNLFFF